MASPWMQRLNIDQLEGQKHTVRCALCPRWKRTGSSRRMLEAFAEHVQTREHREIAHLARMARR